MLDFFGAPIGKTRSHRIITRSDFDVVAALPDLQDPKSMQVLEIFIDKMDIPWRLKESMKLKKAQAAAEMSVPSLDPLSRSRERVRLLKNKPADPVSAISKRKYSTLPSSARASQRQIPVPLVRERRPVNPIPLLWLDKRGLLLTLRPMKLLRKV